MKIRSGISKAERIKIGKRLRELAERQGFTWEEMENALGIKSPTISQHESGIAIPSTETALRYEAFFGEPLEKIFGKKLARTYRDVASSRFYSYRIQRKKEVSIQALRMRYDREQAGLSLEQMAEAMNNSQLNHGTAPILLSQTETGIRPITLEKSAAYATILGKNLERYFPLEIGTESPSMKVTNGKIPVEEDNPLSKLLNEELKTKMYELIQRLKPKQRDTIILRFYENKTRKEIGEKLGLTPAGTIYAENRAIENLRDIAGKYFE